VKNYFLDIYYRMNNLAILSPYENAYSETFIQAHRRLPFNILFYCNAHNYVPSELAGTSRIIRRINKVYFKLKSILFTKLSPSEHSLKYLLKKKKIDCVLAEYGVTAAASLKVIQSLKLPLIVHFHGFDASDKNVLGEYREKYIEVFQYARIVVSVSKKMSIDLSALGCPLNKIVLNPYGPDPDFFGVKPTFTQKHFTAIGRFVAKKAPHLTITAFSKIAEQYPDAKLFLGGTGNLLNACMDQVKTLGIEKQVSFLGRISQPQIKDLFFTSLAFIQHSVTAENGDSEGTPVAILEACAAGLPVIATRHAGIPDVIEHGVTGFLVEEFDTGGMANYMKELCENQEMAKQMGLRGSQNIRLNFTIEKHLNCLTELINQVIANKKKHV
jgi:glycosyltransferase involved in cell wall biosynthesis